MTPRLRALIAQARLWALREAMRADIRAQK